MGCGLGEILPQLYPQVVVPEEVVEELQRLCTPVVALDRARNPPGWLIIQSAMALDNEADLATLGRGERAAITLALEHKPDVLLIIDESAYS